MRNHARRPLKKFRHAFGSTNVTTSAWVELIASMDKPASYVEIFNSSGSILKLSTGAAASEDSYEIPYYVLPNGSSILLPIEFANLKRISAKAVDVDATMGSLILNFFE